MGNDKQSINSNDQYYNDENVAVYKQKSKSKKGRNKNKRKSQNQNQPVENKPTKNDKLPDENEYSDLYYSDDPPFRDVKQQVIVDIMPPTKYKSKDPNSNQNSIISNQSQQNQNNEDIQIPKKTTSSQYDAKPEIKIRKKNQKPQNQSEKELQKAYNDLVEKNKPPPPMFYIPIQRELQRNYIRSLENEDYEESEKIDSALCTTSRVMEEAILTERQNSEMQDFKERKQNINNQISKKQAEWKNIFEQYKEETQVQHDELLKRHQDEEDEFASLWGNPENLAYFNKPSAKLLQLRSRQKSLAIARNFAEAKSVKAEVEQLQQIESQEAQRRAVDAMVLAHQAMQARHQREIDCFLEKSKRTEQFLKEEMRKDFLPLEMQMKKLQNNINSGRLMNGKTKPRSRDISEASTPISIKDSATQRAMQRYRYKTEPLKLDINGIDVKSLMKRPPSCIRVTKKQKN